MRIGSLIDRPHADYADLAEWVLRQMRIDKSFANKRMSNIITLRFESDTKG
jgi:hypothetical protein